MMPAQLHQHTALSGGKTGEYLGVETTLSFAGTAQELETLRSGCAVFGLNWRALISGTGKDRVRWLHNMVTNNVRDLTLNRGNYNFVLNAQGRILGDIYVFNRGESLLLETDRTQVEVLLATLKRFIIMDKVELESIGNAVAIGLAGPGATHALASVGIDVSGMQPLEIQDRTMGEIPVQLIRGAEQKPNWFEVWIDSAHAQTVTKLLSDAGAQPVGAEALDTWRILCGIPQYGKDIRDRDLPQETGQAQALSFTKGCYIGQETVARLHYRGKPNRMLRGLRLSAPASPGDPIRVGERDVGTVGTAVLSPSHGPIALAIVRREAAPGDVVTVGDGVEGEVVEPPF